MAELGVGEKQAVAEQGRPDAGAERQKKHRPAAFTVVIFARTEFHLGQPGGVGVVYHPHRAGGQGLEKLGDIFIQPVARNIGRRTNRAVFDHARITDADRGFGRIAGDQVPDDIFRFVGSGGAGDGRVCRLADKSAFGRIDRGGLDAAAADVDAEYEVVSDGFVHGGYLYDCRIKFKVKFNLIFSLLSGPLRRRRMRFDSLSSLFQVTLACGKQDLTLIGYHEEIAASSAQRTPRNDVGLY